MKYTHILFLLATVGIMVFTSCGDKTGTLSPINPDTTGDFEYEVQNLKDVSIERIGEVRYLITVARTSGESHDVLLSAEDLPDGLEVFFDPVNGVDAPFNTSIVIKSVRVPIGTYKIKIKGASTIGGINNYYTNVEITPYSNAAIGLKGEFTEQANCTNTGNVSHNVRIVIDEAVKNRIQIKGLFSGVMTNEIYADINPNNKTLNIPKQTINNADYEGEGTYEDDILLINYTVKNASLDLSCSSTITRMK